MKTIIKRVFSSLGIDQKKLQERVSTWSLKKSLQQNGDKALILKLREIVPDISNQESRDSIVFNEYIELKRRSLHAFQCNLILKALDKLSHAKTTVVDIGDSAGTHMLYLKTLTNDKYDIDTISVNLDPRAIDKIKARGLNAVQCRAEELDLGKQQIDLFTTFQMVEHLHNPALFFHRLAKKSSCSKLVMTVPYSKYSRIGLHHLRQFYNEKVFAEDEHIFELSPGDWSLLLLHSGWKVIDSEIYYQYPRKWPFISHFLSRYWRSTDFEGFWGAILEKDTKYSDLYQDWED